MLLTTIAGWIVTLLGFLPQLRARFELDRDHFGILTPIAGTIRDGS